MTLPPSRPSSRSSPIDVLDYEFGQERASALGRLGRALEAALAALSDYDAGRAEPPCPQASSIKHQQHPTRALLVQEASNALWCFMVQREACGLRDPRPVLRDYRVPTEVYVRMGVFPRR